VVDRLRARAEAEVLGRPLELGCGAVLKNRLVKAAMSDSLGDGAGDPTDEQIRLYGRWSSGGAGLSIIGEVQVDPRYPERPGNLVLGPRSDRTRLARLVQTGSRDGAHIWPQLGHAGGLAYPPLSHPAGPSALNSDGLSCNALSLTAIEALPERYAAAARLAQAVGFRGVEVHAGHGFLLSQFLSPLFNRRTDRYGGGIEARCQILVDIVRRVRRDVGPELAIAVRVNSSDHLEGGLTEDEAITVVELIGNEAVDLIDISGGSYVPGAVASTDRPSSGPYYLSFATRARTVTDTPLMLTGGIKTRGEASAAVGSGAVDVVGLARALALDPDLPARWLRPEGGDPEFPRFRSPPPGGVTAWYTMRLAALADHREAVFRSGPEDALADYESRDAARVAAWNEQF
jgi:2,4-dienoyl-CoA reductase-like NADH-dependent reductase (Old Yellow Enzyme family)